MLGSTGVEATEFAGAELCTVRDLVAGGQIVLLCDEVPADRKQISGRRTSSSRSASVPRMPLSGLTGEGGPRYPLVIGQRESIRHLCAPMPTVCHRRHFRTRPGRW
ncbi:hypothetical protein E1193_04860 [Micromonospora sp. KC606]|uniref:hypothetical protein n=1 Tax=Micromonospora sp. KC606 TaxID=2530379 RepID=UPI00104355A8|nr:hypothetical protein [Micromonospora sp. KC606]TDC84660.1 hypothetical protein E1193_04860 [Micromonospora sp. KC606]